MKLKRKTHITLLHPRRREKEAWEREKELFKSSPRAKVLICFLLPFTKESKFILASERTKKKPFLLLIIKSEFCAQI
jgi:hypothetical protein